MSTASGGEIDYRRRRRRRRRLWLLGLAAAAVLVAVTARRPDLDDPCDARTAPAAETALMPAGLSFEGIGTVTRVRRDPPNVDVQAVTNKPPAEVAILIQDAVTAAGYRFVGMDSEANEAEVFFTRGPFAAGQARVAQSACAGRWDIDLVLLDRG